MSIAVAKDQSIAQVGIKGELLHAPFPDSDRILIKLSNLEVNQSENGGTVHLVKPL